MANISLAEFADKLNELMPKIARGFLKNQDNDLLKGKITVAQLFVLCFLSRNSEVTMSEIANYLEVSTAAATGIVDRLVKSAYLARVYSEQDRRIIKIKLTVKGQDLVEKIVKQKKQRIMDIFGKISDKERDDYLRILMRIHEIIEKDRQI